MGAAIFVLTFVHPFAIASYDYFCLSALCEHTPEADALKHPSLCLRSYTAKVGLNLIYNYLLTNTFNHNQMKKLLLSLLCVASSLAASAERSVVYYFDGTDDAYGMTRTSNSGDWNPAEITLTPIEQETVILRGQNHTRLWSDGLRMYNGSSIEVIAPAGYVLTTIKIQTKTAAQAKKFTLADGCSGVYTTGKITIGTAGTEEVDGGTWTGSSSSVTLNDNESSNAVILSLTVNYEEDKYQPAGMSFPQESYEATIGQPFSTPELTKATDAVVTYSSSDESVASVDASTGDVTLVGAGVTVITATAPQTDAYAAGSASYTLTVIDPNAVETTSAAMFDFTTANAYNLHTSNSSLTKDEATLTQGECTMNIKIVAGSGYRIYNASNGYELRIQASSGKGASITIASPAGSTISKIVMAGDAVSASVFGFDANEGDYSYDSANKAGTWTPSETFASNTLTFSNKAQAKIHTIEVTYVSKESKPVTPDATVDGATVSNEGTIDLKGSAKTIKFEGLAEGVNIWYKFEPAIAVTAEYTPEEGFSKYDAATGISLTQAGTLTYYAEKDGVAGDMHTITVEGTATGISEIEADDAATEWFDLSGRRVAAPAKGIYLRKQGAKVAKIAF